MIEALERYVEYERDELGAPFAVEVIAVERWDDSLLEPPDPLEADVRVLRIRDGRAPQDVPPWLAVQLEGKRLAEAGPTDGPYAAPKSGSLGRLGRELWSAVRGEGDPSPPLDDYLGAGAAAVLHPRRVPGDRRRRLALLQAFCRRRENPLGRVAALDGAALEWWFNRRFGSPEDLARAVLLARIRERAPADADELEFLQRVAIPDDDPAYAELALDRRVLLEQASPWRYFEEGGMAAALAAVRTWRQRFVLAYQVHAAALRERARALRSELEGGLRAVRAVERLDRIVALGPPLGVEATAGVRASIRALARFQPDPAAAPLGRDPALFIEAARAMSDVRAALERQRERLAAAATRQILARPGIEPLDRLLQAIQASDLDGIERILDDALAAHIETLLEEAASPLATLASRYPLVSRDNLDEAVEAFRGLLASTLEAAPGQVVALR